MLPRWRRLRKDLRAGWSQLRQGSAETVNRSLEEVELLRLRFQLEAVREQMKDLFCAAGERAFQLLGREAEGIMDDLELTRLFERVDHLKQEEARIRFEMDQVRE